MPDLNQLFLEKIRANPGDLLPRQIYADWLEEQGDIRGSLIRQLDQPYEEPESFELAYYQLLLERGIDVEQTVSALHAVLSKPFHAEFNYNSGDIVFATEVNADGFAQSREVFHFDINQLEGRELTSLFGMIYYYPLDSAYVWSAVLNAAYSLEWSWLSRYRIIGEDTVSLYNFGGYAFDFDENFLDDMFTVSREDELISIDNTYLGVINRQWEFADFTEHGTINGLPAVLGTIQGRSFVHQAHSGPRWIGSGPFGMRFGSDVRFLTEEGVAYRLENDSWIIAD